MKMKNYVQNVGKQGKQSSNPGTKRQFIGAVWQKQ